MTSTHTDVLPGILNSSANLPAPPTDGEKYWYLGRQHRWLLVFQAMSFALIAYSVAKFSISDLRLLLFIAPMSLYSITLLISLFSSTRRRRTDVYDHDLRVSEWAPTHYPSVDVFLPTAGEPLDVLRNTYEYVSRLAWPAELVVWVLDDGARTEIAQLAAEYGFEYRTRSNRGHLKKAGNLRFGFEQSRGDYIAILDADFVPRSDYLYELMPYFEESSVGIVQSPQFFDAHKGMHWLQRCAGSTQELFYRWIQPARDRSKAAICVGTCAVYRRSALNKSGGFAQIGHSEDVHTGVNLMKVGYHVRYVPVAVSKGICPDTLTAFLNQQYRWCTGSMSLLANQDFHNAERISPRQRLCFWAGFLYYISTAVNAFTAPLPAIAMLWLLPEYVYPENSIWLVGALIMWLVVVPSLFRSRWRIDVLRIQLLYSFAHAVAIIHVLSGRTREWVATGTATTKVTPLATTITRTMKFWTALTMVTIWAGLVRGILEYGIERFWAMAVLAVLAAYIQIPVLLLRNKVTKPAPVPADKVIDVSDRWVDAQPVDSTVDRVIDLRDDVLIPTPRAPRTPRSGASASGITTAGSVTAVGVPTTAGDDRPPSQETPDIGAPESRVGRRRAPAPDLRKFRPDIQGLRAIAVLLVVLYHADIPGITGGYVGVDVFFVISGFLITSQLVRQVKRTGKISFLDFYAGRMRRLLPSAVLMVVVTVVVARLWGSLFQVKNLGLDAIYTMFYGLNYRLASEGINYQQANGPESPLQHMWSLAVEEQFYVIWPLIIVACALIGRRYKWQLLGVVLVAITALSLFYSVTVTKTNAPLAYFSLHTRAWELAIGAVVALTAAWLVRMPGWFAAPLSWAGAGAVLWSGFTFTDSTPFPGTAALVPVLGAAAVIVAGCRPSRLSAERLLALRPMQGIGKVSYAWYLWHWPMVILIPIMAGRDLSWPYKLQIMVLALWFAILSYYLVESPSLRSRLRRPAWLGSGFAMSGVAAAVAAAVIVSVPSLVGSGAASALTIGKADTAGLQAAILKSLTVKDVPRNLTPPLARAAGDQPITSKDGCHLEYLKTVQGPCIYGDPGGSRTLVLVGDSHAQQWLPAFDAAAKKLGWRVMSWTKAACPIAQGTYKNSLLHRDFTECNVWRESIVKRLRSTQPDLVVISQSDTVPGTQVGNTEWAERTAATIGKIRASGTPVAYILDTPYPGKNVPDCLASNLTDIGKCSMARKNVMPYNGRHDTMQETLQVVGVPTVDPIPWFCGPVQCPAVIGNLLAYRDASHMSTSYAVGLAPMVEPLFVPRKR